MCFYDVEHLLKTLKFRKIPYEYKNNILKTKGYIIYEKNERYIVEKDEVEQYSSDNGDDIYSYVVYADDNLKFGHKLDGKNYNYVLLIYNKPAEFCETIFYETRLKKFILIKEDICYMNAGCANDITINEITKDNLPLLLDESQKNGFLSNEQRKYLEGYIKL